MNPTRNRKALFAIVGILVVIVLIILAIFYKSGKLAGPLGIGSNNKKTISVNPNAMPGEIVATGWTVCIQPTTGPGCVIGLAGELVYDGVLDVRVIQRTE